MEDSDRRGDRPGRRPSRSNQPRSTGGPSWPACSARTKSLERAGACGRDVRRTRFALHLITSTSSGTWSAEVKLLVSSGAWRRTSWAGAQSARVASSLSIIQGTRGTWMLVPLPASTFTRTFAVEASFLDSSTPRQTTASGEAEGSSMAPPSGRSPAADQRRRPSLRLSRRRDSRHCGREARMPLLRRRIED